MELTKVQRYILYTIGTWYEEAENIISDKSLMVSLSKKQFIDLARGASFVSKKERALYKNLESLELAKLVSYKEKNLILTEKGKRHYAKIKRSLEPYVYVTIKLKEKDPMSLVKKIQTRFR